MSRVLMLLLLGALLAACVGSSPLPAARDDDQGQVPLVTVYKSPT
jgi:hypothetical protein